jgi:hypothetical protein
MITVQPINICPVKVATNRPSRTEYLKDTQVAVRFLVLNAVFHHFILLQTET